MTVPKPELHIQSDGLQYTFGSYSLSPDGTLLRDSAVVPIPPKELLVLRLFLENAGQIVPADRLRQVAWGDVHVSPDSLPRCISSLRARLESEECIQTIYKRGYRFILPVKQMNADRLAAKTVDRRSFRPNTLPRLAVLPFTVGDGVPAYLGPGIAEQTMLRFSRTRNAAVDILARDSVFTLAERGTTAQDIGSMLHADLILTGSVIALARHYRLSAEMIRVYDGVQLWVEDFLVPRELLAYADARMAKRITARIRDTFATPIAPVIKAPMAMPNASAPNEAQRSQAYSLYLQACSQWNTLERHHLLDAIRGFQQALNLDPALVSARLHLMHGSLALSSFGYLCADHAAETARKQAEILHATNPDGHSVDAALGWIHFHHDRDLAAATSAFDRTYNARYNPWSVVYRARFALGQCRFSEAIELLRTALKADPYSAVLHGRMAWALYLSGDASAAVEQAKRTAALFPDHPGALFFCSNVFAGASREDSGHGARSARKNSDDLAVQATNLASRLIQAAPYLDAGYATLAYAQARQGRIIEARALLDRRQWQGNERLVMRSFHVPVLVELGEFDAALNALTAANEQHCPWLFELLADPRLHPLQGESEFERIRSLIQTRQPVGASVA